MRWATDSEEETEQSFDENQINFLELPTDIILSILKKVDDNNIDNVVSNMFFTCNKLKEVITDNLKHIYRHRLPKNFVDFSISMNKLCALCDKNEWLAKSLIQLVARTFSRFTLDGRHLAWQENVNTIIYELRDNCDALERLHFWAFCAPSHRDEIKRLIRQKHPNCIFTNFQNN